MSISAATASQCSTNSGHLALRNRRVSWVPSRPTAASPQRRCVRRFNRLNSVCLPRFEERHLHLTQLGNSGQWRL
jgi:hypothetical protein